MVDCGPLARDVQNAMFECVEKQFRFSIDVSATTQMCVDNFWILSKSNLEQMLRDLFEEAGKWDLGQKPASIWWTCTYEPEER